MNYSKLVVFTLISVIITDAFWNISIVGALNIDSATYIAALLIYISIAIFIRFASTEGFGENEIPNPIKNLFILWLAWNIFNLIRGGFLASYYWDWKYLFFNSFSFSLIPMVFFLGKNLMISRTIFTFTLKYLFPFGFLVIPLTLVTNEELYSRLMIPISLFMVFIPYLKIKWKLLIIIVATTSILMVIGFRSNIIKASFSVILLLIYYFHYYIHLNWVKIAHFFLFALPLVLFTLGATDTYNIFHERSEEEGYYTTDNLGNEENLMTDTRTFLYVEILSSLKNSGNWIIGEGAAGSYESEWFYDDGGAIEGKRYGCEVGILNILMRFGIIGVIIYFCLLFSVSYYAIYFSSNLLSKLLGLFIAFRWTYSFVEEFTTFDLNFYFFWLIIGLVSSVAFRSLNDTEIRNYLNI